VPPMRERASARPRRGASPASLATPGASAGAIVGRGSALTSAQTSPQAANNFTGAATRLSTYDRGHVHSRCKKSLCNEQGGVHLRSERTARVVRRQTEAWGWESRPAPIAALLVDDAEFGRARREKFYVGGTGLERVRIES
jgi:hypothetical protein